MSRISGEIDMIFFSYCPLKKFKFDIAIFQMQYLKSIKAKDLKPVLADKER